MSRKNSKIHTIIGLSPKSKEKEIIAHLEDAWLIIANAHGGDWNKETQDWQAAAEKWRDKFYNIYDNYTDNNN